MNEKDFISYWKQCLLDEGLKKFPDNFKTGSNIKTLALPGKTLIIGNQFFGSFELITADGSQFMQTDNYHQAKYIIYANRERPDKITIPLESNDIKKAVDDYEEYITSIIKKIERDYKKKFPAGKNSSFAVNEVLRMLNLVRY